MKKKSFRSDDRAITGDIWGIAMAGIAILLALFVWAQLYSALPTVNDTDYNATKAKVSTNIYKAFDILTVAVIIGAILVIVALVMRVFRGTGGGGME